MAIYAHVYRSTDQLKKKQKSWEYSLSPSPSPITKAMVSRDTQEKNDLFDSLLHIWHPIIERE